MMNVATTLDGTTLNVSVCGRLDSTTADDFMDAIKAQLTDEVTDVVIDMEQVDFLSSKGLRMLVLLYKQFGQGHIHLKDPNPPVREVLRLANLLTQFGLD